MNLLIRILFVPLIIIAAILLSGLYGIVHDQLSYTLSPDFFHHLKFDQFQIAESYRNRIGASMVGWGGTWWMGIPIGIMIGGFSVIQRNVPRQMRAVGIAFVVALVITALFGAVGFVVGWRTAASVVEGGYSVPLGAGDPVAYVHCGIVHNFGYLGGMFGIVGGVMTQIIFRLNDAMD